MAYATSIRHTNFQFLDGTAIIKIYDNQSLDYPFSSFKLVSHIYVTPVDAEVDWSVQVGPVRPGPDETIVFGPITASQDPGHYTITATVDISSEGWRTIGVSERNSNTNFPLSITYPGHSSYSGGYMEFSPDFQYIDSGVSAPYTYFPLYDSQSPSGITIANVVASGFTFEPSYNGNTLGYRGVKSVSWDDDNLEYGGPKLYMDPNNQKVVANNFKANTGLTERRFRAWFPIGDTRGNSWIDDFTFIQKSEYSDPPIPSGQTIDSGSTSHTITYSGCPLVFDHSASTGTWNTLPTVTTGGTTNDWWITYDIPANDTDSARTITYYYLRYAGETCSDLVDTVSYTITQEGGGSTPTPPDPPIPSGTTIGSGGTGTSITYSGCPLVFDHSASTGTWNEYPTLTTGGTTDAWRLTYTVPINTTPSARTVTYYFRRYSGNTCEDYVDTVSYTIEQAASTTEPVVYAQPTYHNVNSDAGVVEYNFYTLNCSFTGAGLQLYSSSITMGDWSTGPAYAEIVKVSDTHMIVRLAYPQNITNQVRTLTMTYIALTDAGQNLLTILFTQFEYHPSSGSSATSITLNVDSAITGSGIATTTVNPGDATVNLRYTSSNSTIATIDQSGRITVVRNGQVTICVKDLITGLQDCKTIRVTKGSTPGGDDDDLIYVYTGITVNDNEGHRYNITAEPGYKYGCLGKTYKTVNACEARYSLYYINAYGGVDVLPCKGKSSMKKDNITRYNYSRTFRNNTLEFENTNYLSEIKTTWQLHTGYMVDTQSEKMHHLVESTCVFLYDALEQTYTPVVMTDKTLEYKTFHNQGRTFYDYTINIEESQSRERR